MRCPRLHGSLSRVILNADFVSPQIVYLCPECHATWLRSLECRAFLGIDTEDMLERAVVTPVVLECPHCGGEYRLVDLVLENKSHVGMYVCPQCYSCFLDGSQFALLFHNQIKLERSVSGILPMSPLDKLGICCCDCNAEVTNLDDLYDAMIGYCCKRCQQSPPLLSENRVQNVQLVTFRNMEIKIDHWQLTGRSRIAVTPTEPCPLDVRISSLDLGHRLMMFGYRKLDLRGQLRKYLEASESVAHRTPFQLFLKQRGVVDLLGVLVDTGQISITFKSHSIIFELQARRMGTDARLRFEIAVRRMLLAYERFISLCARYT